MIFNSDFTHQESFSREIRDDGRLSRDEMKLVTKKLGLFCSPESDEFQELYGAEEVSGIFQSKNQAWRK